MAGFISPLLRRKIFEPLHGRVTGSPRLAYWRDLEKTQFWPKEDLLALQWRRLKSLLSFVHENNEFYRKRFQAVGITPQDIHTPSDLSLLPVLTKEEIRAHLPEMISQGYRVEDLLQCKTGGSTGKSLTLYVTEECSEWRNACARRHDRWTGWEAGDPVGAVWGNPKRSTGVKGRLRQSLLSPFIYLDTMAVTETSVLEFARLWRKVRPSLLFGHAHSLFLLAKLVRELQIDDIRPKGILSTSMMLLPHERREIEKIFRVRVTNRYGCEEVSLIASECERHEGLHINIEHLLVEFLLEDGTPAEPGEPGAIVVTDLMNQAMPFIRYRVEDVGIPTARECSCGRGLPLMDSVTGRVADFLVKQDGTKVAGISLIENTLTKMQGIEQMQIIQNDLKTLDLNLVVNSEFSNDSHRNIIDYFRGIFGSSVLINLHFKNNLSQDTTGKYRFSISKVG